MPQDSLKSVVYRSFVTCDDPKGVVECGTIRKSKANTQKIYGEVEILKIPKNLSASSSNEGLRGERKNMVSRGSSEKIHSNPSSLQLMEVSKGALKLNQVINSWSRGMSSDGKSKDVAKDLLKGALDLQESLIMFGKLQEASQYVARLKKKQKEKSGEVMNFEVERERINSYYNYPTECEKPRLSADGSSRDCYEELRRVVKDSLAKQNLFSHGSSGKREHFGGKKVDLSLEIPSHNSSISNNKCCHRFSPFDCSISSKVPTEKPGTPTLIAKLMGLEEMPSKALHSVLVEKWVRENILNQRRPVVDIDVPKARKLLSVNRKMNAKQKTLEEILETMQNKGLLRRISDEDSKYKKHHSNGCNLKERFSNDIPPIVIMKPHQFPIPEEEEVHKDVIIQEHKAPSLDRLPGKWKMKKEVSTKNGCNPERATMSNEQHVEKIPVKSHSQEKGHKDSKEVLGKSDVKEVKENLPSKKMNASVDVNSKVQKKEATEKKFDSIKNAAPSRRKPTETASVKAIVGSKSNDQVKLPSRKETKTKTEAKSNLSKKRTPQQKVTISKSIDKRTTPTIPQKSCHRSVKDDKKVAEPPEVSVGNIRDENDDLLIVHTNEIDYDSVAVNNASSMQFQEGRNASVVPAEETCENSSNSLLEATLLTTHNTQHEDDFKNISETNCIIANVEDASCLTRPSPKDLLLNSASFITCARELFDIETCQPLAMQTSLYDSEVNNTRLLVDCATEVLERKSIICTSTVGPMLKIPARTSRISFSLDHLMEEVCKEIENLRINTETSGESLALDTLYTVLQRDLWWKGALNGAWDFGWRHGYTMDEVDQVVSGIEKLVLSGLIEELLMDFML